MRIQINFISSTSINFQNETHYYMIQVQRINNTSSPVQDSTISSSTSMENEEHGPIVSDGIINIQEQNPIFREVDQILIDVYALMAEL